MGFRRKLARELSRKSASGSFACWHNNLPGINPGLRVRDLGHVGLPIHDAEAQRIISAATKSPYGKGTETIVDEKVRQTWEIDSCDLTIENPKWAQWLADVIKQVKEGLGLGTETIHAELYKLLIYSQGAHFKPHRDSEKVANMFGTLVISLPSPHEGGDVHLIHDGNEKVFSSSSNSAFETSCAAWYADVLHEVKPVTSGYRVVLTYNLIMSGSFRPSAQTATDEQVLTRLLDRYVTKVGGNNSMPLELIYKLGHKYTQANLKADRLKRNDQTVLKRLQNVAGDKFELYLALLEREIEGSCDESYGYYGGGRGMYEEDSDEDEYDYEDEEEEEEEEEEDYRDEEDEGELEELDDDDDEDDDNDGASELFPANPSEEPEYKITDMMSDHTDLKHVTDLNGEPVADKLPANKASLLQRFYGKHRAPDKEDYEEGYSGNEGGPTVTHWYRDAVLVIVPKQLAQVFKLGPNLENQALFPAIVDSLISRIDHGDSAAKDELLAVCKVYVQKELRNRGPQARLNSMYYTPSRKTEPERAMLHACAATRDPELFCQVMALIDNRTPIDCFELMGQRFHVPLPERTKCLELLKNAIARMERPAERLAALSGFSNGYHATSTGSDTSVSDFVGSSMDMVIDGSKDGGIFKLPSGSSLSHKDGLALVAVLTKHNRTDLCSKVLKLVQRAPSTTGAAIGLLRGMLEYYHNSRDSSHEILQGVFQPLYDSLIQQFDLRNSISNIVQQPSYSSVGLYASRSWRAEPQGSNNPQVGAMEFNADLAQQTARLYEQCLRAQSISESRLLDAIAANIDLQWSMDDFGSFVLPFLRSLLDVLANNSIPIDGHEGRYQSLFRKVVQIYVSKHVGMRPSPPRDWFRREVSCICPICGGLNSFLNSRERQVGRFCMGEDKRNHLLRELATHRESFDHNTERSMRPFTLVITKNNKRHERDVRKWQDRCARAKADLGRIGLDTWQVMLGPEHFDGRTLRIADSPFLQQQQQQQQQPLSITRNPLTDTHENSRVSKRGADEGQSDSPATKRRHVDVIDLTD